MAERLDKNRSKAEALRESKELLDRCEFHGLLVKQVAEILGLSEQRVSDYRRAARAGTGSAIPRNSRIVLATFLDEMDRKATPGRQLYPSERAAIAHDLVEHMARLTEAKGPWWRMYEELARSIIRMVESGERHEKGAEGAAGMSDGGGPREADAHDR